MTRGERVSRENSAWGLLNVHGGILWSPVVGLMLQRPLAEILVYRGSGQE